MKRDLKAEIVAGLEKVDFNTFNRKKDVLYKEYLFRLKQPEGATSEQTRTLALIIDLRDYDGGVPEIGSLTMSWADIKTNQWTNMNNIPQEVMDIFLSVNKVNEPKEKVKE